MLEYITKNEYQEILGTTNVPSNFNQLNIRASSIINRRTRGKIVNVDDKIKYTTACLINLLDENNNKRTGNLKSTNIEGWSESYKTDSELDEELNKEIEELLQTYLWDTGLLSQGVVLYE